MIDKTASGGTACVLSDYVARSYEAHAIVDSLRLWLSLFM